jgi:hypothetical protein
MSEQITAPVPTKNRDPSQKPDAHERDPRRRHGQLQQVPSASHLGRTKRTTAAHKRGPRTHEPTRPSPQGPAREAPAAAQPPPKHNGHLLKVPPPPGHRLRRPGQSGRGPGTAHGVQSRINSHTPKCQALTENQSRPHQTRTDHPHPPHRPGPQTQPPHPHNKLPTYFHNAAGPTALLEPEPSVPAQGP